MNVGLYCGWEVKVNDVGHILEVYAPRHTILLIFTPENRADRYLFITWFPSVLNSYSGRNYTLINTASYNRAIPFCHIEHSAYSWPHPWCWNCQIILTAFPKLECVRVVVVVRPSLASMCASFHEQCSWSFFNSTCQLFLLVCITFFTKSIIYIVKVKRIITATAVNWRISDRGRPIISTCVGLHLQNILKLLSHNHATHIIIIKEVKREDILI